MEGGSPQPSESWCCKVVQVAAGSRTKAEMTVMSSLPAHERIAGRRDLEQCCPHPRREQPQDAKLGEGSTAASQLHEQTQEKSSTSLNGKDGCNSSSTEHAYSLAVSISGKTVVPSVAARSPSATAGPFSALSLVGAATTYSPSTAAARPSRPVKSFPSVPYLHRPSLTSQQMTDPPAAELQAASLDAVKQTETLGSADAQTVEPPAAVAADIEVAGSVSAGAASTQRRDPLSRMSADVIAAAAPATTAVELLFGEHRVTPFSKKEHLEEWILGGGKSSNGARTRKIATRTSPYPQHQSYMASLSLPAWRSQSGIVCDIVQRQQLSATPSKRQSWGRQQQALQRQEEGSQEEAADQQKQQPQEGRVRAKGFEDEHGRNAGDQEEKLKGDHPRGETLQPSRLLQREALQTKNAYMNKSVNGQVTCHAAETIVDDQLPTPQLSSPLALQVAGARSQQHRGGAFAEDRTTKEWTDKRHYDEPQTDTLVVDAGTAVPSLPRRAASGETGNIAELAVARNQKSTSPTDACKAEKKTIQRDSAAVRVSAVGKTSDNGAVTGGAYSANYSLTTFARSNRKSVAGENSNSRNTNIHSCWLRGECGERGCGVKVVLRGETKDSMGGKPWSSSKMRTVETKYSENWLSQSSCADHQVDRLVETGNTFFRSGERGDRRRGNNYSGGVRSVCSSIDGVSPVRCSNQSQSTKDITGAGGAVQWDTAALHGKECHVTVDRRSSIDKKEGNGGARSEQQHWHMHHSGCRCGDTGKARFSWVHSALLKILLLLPRFALAMRNRFGQCRCGPQRKGIEGDVAPHREEVSLDNPRQKHKFPQLSADGKYLQDMMEHKGDEGPAAVEVQKHMENSAAKGAKEWKTHTKDSRAMLECCIPSAPASASMPLGLSRYVLLCVYTLQAFLTGCVYFGWPALSSMLYRSGAYAWLCSPSEVARATSDGGGPVDPADASVGSAPAASRLYLCNSQDAALAPLFTVCHVSDCVMCVVAGFLTDRCSPKGVCMFGQTLHVVGWTLLACSSMHFPAYVPAMVFIGCGCATAYLPLLRVALLFPRSKATTIAILGAANTGSFAVPCILDAIWRRAGVRPNAAAAVAALAGAAVARGASTVSSGESSTEGVTPALHGGSGGGRGWTFTDICLLYLGVGPLCCMLLAAFFLPTHRFSVVAQNQNAWKQKPQSDEKAARQEQRKRWSIILAPEAAPPSGPATGTDSDSLGLSTKTDTEEEGSSTSSHSPTWKLWNVCRHKKGKQQTVHLQRQQKQDQPAKSRHFRSPFYRHRQHEEDCEPWQRYCLRELQCSESRVQRQREAGTGMGSQLQVGEVLKQCASEEASYESTEFRVSVSEDQAMSLQQKVENQNHRSNACTDGIVECGTQQPLENKWQGRPHRGCEYGTDLPMMKRRARGAEGLEKIKRETSARFAIAGKEKQNAASAAQMETPVLGVRLSPRQTREAGGGSKWRRASRGSPRTAFRTAKIKTPCCVLSKVKVSSKETHFLRDFFPCKEKKRRAAANRQEVAKQTQNNCVSSEILSGPSLAAVPSFQTLAALTQPPRLLPQEERSLTRTQTGMRRERFVAPADANKGKTTERTEEALHSEGRDCTSAPESDVETGKHYGKDGADAVCCERMPSAAGNRRTENTDGAPKEKRITERVEATEGHQRHWWGWRKFPLYDLCCSLVTTRQMAPREKGGGDEDDREGTDESNEVIEGGFCHATSLNSVDENCPQTGFAEHHPQQDAHSEGSSRFVASLYKPDQASAYGAFRQNEFPSDATAPQGTSTTGSAAPLQTAPGADHFSTARVHPSSKHCVTSMQQMPDNRGLTTVAQEIVAAAAKSLRAPGAPEETAGVVSKEASSTGAPHVQTATAHVAAAGPVSPDEKTVYGAAELPGCGCSARADGTDACATRAAATVLFASSGPKEAGTVFVRDTTDACCLFAGTGPADHSIGSGLPRVELPKKKATFFSQCLSVHFACLVFYSGVVSVALSFMQSSASRLFSARVLTFMDWALPFSFIPCILLGRAMDMVGPFPVLLFMNSMGLLSYLCAASTPLEGVHYLSVLAFCVYVSLDSEQVYCYVEYTFRPEHFGRLSGLLMAIDGTMSLVSIPLYDNLTVRNLGGNPLPVAFGISGLLGAAYLLLTGLWLHRRKYPDPFGLLDENSAGTSSACSRYGAVQTGEEQAEEGALKANKEDREPTDVGVAPPAINLRRDPAAAMEEYGEAAQGRTD